MESAKPYSRVLIALEGGILDETILRYSAYLLSYLRVDHLFLCHVSKDLTLPAEIREKYADLLPPKEEQLEKYLTELYNYTFGQNVSYAVQTVLLEGEPFEQILRQAHIKDIDLIIMGRKPKDRDHSQLGARISEQGPCSVLLVPTRTNMEINEIFLPLDFSEASKRSLNFAKDLSEQLDAEVRAIHFYALAKGFLKNAEAERELRIALKDQSTSDWHRFKKELSLPVQWTCEMIENRGEAPSHSLFLAEHFGSDLIILSSKGRTASASVLMGSFAKELINQNRRIPLMIIKRKRENLDFLEALSRLLD